MSKCSKLSLLLYSDMNNPQNKDDWAASEGAGYQTQDVALRLLAKIIARKLMAQRSISKDEPSPVIDDSSTEKDGI